MRLDPIHLTPDFENERLWVVTSPIRYRVSDVYDWEITVPAGFKSDLASLPPLTAFLVRMRKQQHRINSGAILHDYIYATQGCSRSIADSIVEGQWRDDGIPRLEAKLFRTSVQLFGKRAYKTGPARLAANCPDLKVSIGTAPAFENLDEIEVDQ